MLLAVSYHYVVEQPPDEPRAIFPVTMAELDDQVQMLARTFELVSRDDLLAAVAGHRTLPAAACVLTFDDGLRCQAELAVPVLECLAAPAIFFVPGRPLAERRVLAVHKLNAVRERLDEATFASVFADELDRRGVDVAEVSDEEAAAHYRYDTPEAARAKFLLNVALPTATRDAVVGALFDRLVTDEAAFAQELYMDAAQVSDLERNHRAVGAHSYAHVPLASLPDDELDNDLARAASTLEAVTGRRPAALSYPYGTATTVDLRTARRAAAAGYRVAFTMERAVNNTLDNPLLLARVDTNDAPGGRRPLDELLEIASR